MEQTPYGSNALWNLYKPKSVYNPMKKTTGFNSSTSDVVQQQGGVSRWIQNDMGFNANTMSETDLLGLNDKYERGSTDLGNNWERQRVIDKATGKDVASNDYYHEPFNFMKDVVANAALIYGGGYGLSNMLFGAAGAAGGAGGLAGDVAGHGAWLGEGAASGVGAWDAALANAGLGEAAGAAGAASGTSNLYSLGGGEVGGSGTLIPGTGTTGLQATAGPGTSLFTPTAQGAGLTVPGLTAAGGTGAMDVLKGLGKALIGGQAGGISALGNLASLFTNYKQYSNTGDLIDEIKGIYSPDGVYAKELEKQLARRDAAAGRNSQYGPRLAELMARLGDSQARSLGGLGGMMQTQQGGLNGMVGSGSRLLDGLGGLEKLFSIFGD